MKKYVSHNQLRLVGKGWEVRHQLQRLATEAEGTTLLTQFTSCHPSIRIQTGSARAAASRKGRTLRKIKLARKPLI